MSSYFSEGKHLDYTPVAATPAGKLVKLGNRVGIANVDIEANKTGAICVMGTVNVVNSGVAFADGATVGYVVATDLAVAAGGGDFDIGTSIGAVAGVAGNTVHVYLNGFDKVV